MTANETLPSKAPRSARSASSATSAKRRVVGRPWKPGQSGNPRGLPKEIAPAIMEARRLALSHSAYAVNRLRELCDSTDERVAVTATLGLLDRMGLKPYALEPERLEVMAVPVDLDALRATLAARVAALAAAEPRALPSARPSAPESPEQSPALESASNGALLETAGSVAKRATGGDDPTGGTA